MAKNKNCIYCFGPSPGGGKMKNLVFVELIKNIILYEKKNKKK